MKLHLLFILSVVSGEALAAEKIHVKYLALKGKGCEHQGNLAALYVDRASDNSLDTAWKKLEGADLEDGNALSIRVKDLPDNAKKEQVYFRFYALHNKYSADHYESTLRLTKDFAKSLPAGEAVTKELDLKPTFEADKKRKCKLALELTRIVPAPKDPTDSSSWETSTESSPAE